MPLFPDTPRTRLADLEDGEEAEFFALLVQKDKSTTRDGKPYYRVQFRDPGRTVTAMVWNDSPQFADCHGSWQPGHFFRMTAKFGQTKYGPQIDLREIRAVTDDDRTDGFDPADFSESTKFDRPGLFAELNSLAQEHIDDPQVLRLVTEILDDNEAMLLTHPAAARNHHAFVGGFLEHVVSVTRTAAYLADKYVDLYPEMSPPLSKGLVVAGAILHDIGKLIELRATPAGAEYTAEGRLVGHILLGRDIVRDKANQIEDFDAETLLRLEHIVISHQNLPEWGSPISPHTPEALLVHYADDIDAKFQMMASALSPTDAQDEFTGRDNGLRRMIFRGLHRESESPE
ncbi:3'-5' exoribonuclease YhaM family protein [Stratiformator vulcanicus]|uniref:3'-5' exoribonuclease YhaM n=1 Tax=Stratiformator vulcanicus TaxID=2527980 RepID=A0A517R7U3_9PLAN|nr:HD domain-containing protein [Stratiformator vulcanicus]QDT39935.1 3'-5' exoribonuclease YhaM [Stratiformator vulcanicus]